MFVSLFPLFMSPKTFGNVARPRSNQARAAEGYVRYREVLSAERSHHRRRSKGRDRDRARKKTGIP